MIKLKRLCVNNYWVNKNLNFKINNCLLNFLLKLLILCSNICAIDLDWKDNWYGVNDFFQTPI